MEAIYLLRIVLAGLCGALIGYERKNRAKEAGIRTHLVVGVGSALMMVLSKYGFPDQGDWNWSIDPSRIAAQVVSGVGFLGAGMIFMHRQTVKGLTTAAGIWATAGIGMAMGAGLYWTGAGVTLLLLLAQTILHGRKSWLSSPKTELLTLSLADEPGAVDRIRDLLAERKIVVVSFHAERKGPDEIGLEVVIRFSGSETVDRLLSVIQQFPQVRQVSLQE
mgnify:CR=1 FL=1|jgi:putative Mg2+ transporter-C (MgtC) family protein